MPPPERPPLPRLPPRLNTGMPTEKPRRTISIMMLYRTQSVSQNEISSAGMFFCFWGSDGFLLGLEYCMVCFGDCFVGKGS